MSEFTDELRALIQDLHDLDEIKLGAYLELYGEYCRNLPSMNNAGWYSYKGPHSNISYELRLDCSDSSGLYYEGTDRAGDGHSFTLPFDFIEHAEQKAEELAAMKQERAREQAERERLAQVQRAEAAKRKRREQYEILRKEFENE